MISIAIVEDEELYAKQLQQFLHQYEKENKEMFDITVYSDGDQIVNKYKSQYDIILMDVEMKFMDGMSAAEEIRKYHTGDPKNQSYPTGRNQKYALYSKCTCHKTACYSR